MKRFYLLLLGVLFGTTTLMAQDVIVRKDGSTVLAKVEKVGDTTIEYRKWDNPTGPVYTLAVAKILSINYENGTRDNFENIVDSSAPVTSSGGISVPAGGSSTPTKTTTQTTTTKSGWFRDEKWFMMNSELLGIRIGLEGEGFVGTTSSVLCAWNLGRFFHAGAGMELYSQSNSGQFMVNLFGNVCWYVLGKKKITPFLDYRVGLASIGGLYLRESFGMAFGNFTISTGVSFVGMVDEDVPTWDIAFGLHF